ncbi:MAG TPA: gliding motility-associated C-terminal domain-containing protein, partial [Flavobacteriales bacterium]|nr:gliding motility-associated C-terminal domain-containing protein [Flavobacteriales bacterium]
NSFTPDGDNKNDAFMPTGTNIATIELMIFNRWGELIHQGKDEKALWDGTAGGSTVQDGIYQWKVKYRFYDSVDRVSMGAEQERVGHVTLLK